MFIHIGDDYIIQSEDIIAIIDCHLVLSSQAIEEMIEAAKAKKQLFGSSEDAKSVLITTDQIYYSTLSIATLTKRSSMLNTIDKLDDYSDEEMTL